MQTGYGLWIMYGMQSNSVSLEMLGFASNMVFYSMEMKYIICHCLEMNIGEIGPVEVEILVTLFLWSFGHLTPEFY